MASKKNTRKRNTNTKKSSTGSRSSKTTKKQTSFALKDEILILISLAICILLTISNFNLGGYVGDFLSSILFGLFGFPAYIVPVLMFIGIAFVKANKGAPLAYIKLGAGIVFSLMICTLFHLFHFGADADRSLMDIYHVCRILKSGGGLLGGVLSTILCPAIGIVGTYIVTVSISIICLVMLTEKSFLKTVKKGSAKVYDSAKDDVKKHREQAEIRRKEREEQKEQKELAQKRTDKKVSGVSFDTKITQKSPELQELEAPVGDLFTQTLESQSIPEDVSIAKGFTEEPKIKRAEPILEEEDSPIPDPNTSKKRKTKESQKEVEKATVSVEQEIQQTEASVKPEYHYPPIHLLTKGKNSSGDSNEYLRQTALKLQQTLQNFHVNVTVTNISCGPTVTRFELQPEQGVKVSKIVGLADDIKLNLAASDIRIEAPIPGKAAVGIEVPNKENTAVLLRDLLETKEFEQAKSKISFAVGRDIGGNVVVADIAKMPHLLIAGATGSGKSVCINTLIMSILYKAKPEEVKLIMIDPKVVELSVYNGIPHLLIPVVTDPKKAAGALNWAVAEMTKRYQLFADYNVRNVEAYNAKVDSIQHLEDDTKPERMPQIVIIVDELADLMMVAPGEVEDAICRLAQLARAAGIHLVVATQRPSVNVITGLIKANMPSRIAFAVSSGVDSRTIIDMNGAEKLLGRGDMLFSPSGSPKPARVQGSFVSDKEVQSVVDFLKDHNVQNEYNEEITQHVNQSVSHPTASDASSSDQKDIYFVDAGKFVIEKDKASIGMLQRVFKIGFNRAARIMDQLAEAGVVGEEEGTKPRKVLMSLEEFERYIEEYI